VNVERERGVRALAPKVEEFRETLSAEQIRKSLYGLRRMSSDVEEVRRILPALAANIRKCREAFDIIAVGLQNMNSNVLEVLTVLVTMIKSCSDHLDAQEVTNALYGLQNMNGDAVEVLVAMTPEVRECAVWDDDQCLGNAFFGLQGIDDRVDQVTALFQALECQLESIKHALSRSSDTGTSQQDIPFSVVHA
jgi:hypothetical protein